MVLLMICKYSKCEEEAGKNRGGKPRTYCSTKHMKLGRREIKETGIKTVGFKHVLFLGDKDIEDIIKNKKLLDTALKGNVESQEALKETGLKGHYRRDEGGWGSLTYEGSLK